MLHTIQNQFVSVTVAEHGAELQSIIGCDGTEYLWQGDPAYWSDRAPNIFPYVGRLTQGSYYLDGQLYHMQIHGIALYSDFQVICKEPQKITLELTWNEETLAIYPRKFSFRITYVLKDKTLITIYEAENLDDKTMYFGLGGHPGFNVPLVKGKTFEDYRLRFSNPFACKRIGFSEDCFINGQDILFQLEDGCILPLRHDLFDNDAIVLKNMGHQVTLETSDDHHSITVTFPQLDYLGIWHWPKTDAPYVCIEPWSSLPAAKDKITIMEEQDDLIALEAHKSYRNEWTIEIH